MDLGTTSARVLSRRMIAVGLLCIACMSGWLVDVAQDWTYAMDHLRTVETSPGGLSFRDMHSSCGVLGWLGAWGYLAACLWLPLAAWRILRGHRNQVPLRMFEALVVAGVVVLMIVVPWIIWLTGRLYRGGLI